MKNLKQSHYLAGGALLLALVAFYAGGKYASAKTASATPAKQYMMGGQGFAQGARGMRGFGGTAGEIISKDSTGFTVKLQNGGSRIVFVGASTTVQKLVPATAADLAVGQTVIVNGAPNPDGSVTASSVDVRPLPKINQ